MAWQVADIFHLPFDKESFDHVFICFTLEHLKDPVGALAALRSVLAPGGTITAIAMVEGVREQALAAGLLDEESWEKGIRDLYRTTAPDGTFCYTFFKGVGGKNPA